MTKLEEALKGHQLLMEKFGLTKEEDGVAELIFLGFENQCENLEASYYASSGIKTGFRNVLHSLQEKGVLWKSYVIPSVGRIDLDMIRFEENFLKYYRRTSREFGMELLDAYPSEVMIKGQAVPMKDISTSFYNEEEFFYAYGKAIGWNQHIHKEVLRLIQWSKDNDHFGLNMNIADFVISKMWESIHDHKVGGRLFEETVNKNL